MSPAFSTIYVGTVKNSKLDADGCIEVDIPRLGKYRAVVSTMMAGDKRGVLFLPDDGDQVLVASVAGASIQWAVLGCIWSQKDVPPETNGNGKNLTKMIKTRSGNYILLSDENGKERIEIVDKGGKNKVVLDSKDNENVLTIESSGGKIAIIADEINITATKALHLKSEQDEIVIEASGATTIRGSLVDLNP